MNVSLLQHPSPAAADVPLEKFAKNPHVSDAQKVAEASRQFEALLLRQMLAEARKPMFESQLTPKVPGRDFYEDMVNDRLADAMSRNGSFGLARSLERQLSRQLLPKTHSQDGSPTPPPDGQAVEVKP